jgi:outer membrane protein with beta-barrel domain
MHKSMVVVALGLCTVMTTAGGAAADPRTHDGFQFRGAVGPGYLSTSASAGGQDLSIKGISGSTDIYLGGTPVSGLVVGGMLNFTTSFGPKVTVNGQDISSLGENGSNSLTLLTVGPYVNYYFDPTDGLYLLGMVGYGAESYTQNGSSGNSPGGPAFALGVGYDFWVADQWSLGVLGRFTYGSLSLNSVTYSTINPAVMFTFTYQ